MLLVKTRIGPSALEGTGLIAAEDIPAGTHIWKFQPGFDLKIPPEELVHLSAPARLQFLHYAYHNAKTGNYILCFDDARFFNHAEHPNCGEIPSPDDEEGINIALRDIRVGEELTCDYRVFDQDFALKMGL